MCTAPMDLSDDDAAAVEFFKRNAVSTTKGGMEVNVSATVLQMAQKLSNAREALRTQETRATQAEEAHDHVLIKWREIRQSSQAEYDLFSQRLRDSETKADQLRSVLGSARGPETEPGRCGWCHSTTTVHREWCFVIRRREVLAATPAPVAAPVCAKCNGSGKYDAQCAQSQCSGFHDCDCKTPLISVAVPATADRTCLNCGDRINERTPPSDYNIDVCWECADEYKKACGEAAPVAVPAARKEANGVTNFTDTQKAERQAALASMKPTRVGFFTPVPVAEPAKEHCPRRLMGETLAPHAPCDTGDASKDADDGLIWPEPKVTRRRFVDEDEANARVQAAYAECARIVRKFCGDKEPAVGFGELLVSEIEAAARRAVPVRPGALYAAVFPAVPAILRLFIESACPLDAEMARGVLAAVEACK